METASGDPENEDTESENIDSLDKYRKKIRDWSLSTLDERRKAAESQLRMKLTEPYERKTRNLIAAIDERIASLPKE